MRNFLQLDPLLPKNLGTWENTFVAHPERVSPTTMCVIFADTSLLIVEQMGFEFSKKIRLLPFQFASQQAEQRGGRARSSLAVQRAAAAQ